MQGVYYRRNAHVPWRLVRRTRSVADAEKAVATVAHREKRGRLVYLEARELPVDIWDLRGLPHRRLGGWLAKSLLPTFSKVVKGGRASWQPHNPDQQKLFS